MDHALRITTRRIVATAFAVVACFVAANTGVGCSAIVAGPSSQCASDADCPGGSTCTLVSSGGGGRCVEKPECVTTQDCIALGPTSGWEPYDDYIASGYEGQVGGRHGMPGFGRPDGVGLNANGQLFEQSQPVKVPTRICAKGRCVALRESGDAQCAMNLDEQHLFGNPNAPNPLVIGVMADLNINSPSSAPNDQVDANYGLEKFYIRAAALPVLELRQAVGGGAIGGRDLLIVGCSQHRNANRLAGPAAQHLVDLGAVAIIGPTDGAALEQAAKVTVPAGVPVVSPYVMSNTASQVPNATGFLFFPSFFAEDVVAPLNGLLRDREAALRALPNGQRPIKVAVYYYANETFREYDQLKPLIDQKLQFNGGSAISQLGTNYQVFSADQNDPQKSPNAIAAQIVQYNPDIVIPFSGSLEWLGIFDSMDATLSASPNRVTADGKAATPVWLHPLILNEQPYAADARVLGNVDNAVARITGIRPARNALYSTIQAELNRLVGNTNIDYQPGAGRAYETSLLLFYAIAAAAKIHVERYPNEPASELTGLDVKLGIERVTSGTTVVESNPSPSILNSGLNLLNDGKAIKLDGVFTRMKFDDLHHSNVTWETWCADTAKGVNSSSRVLDDAGNVAGTYPNSPCSQLGF